MKNRRSKNKANFKKDSLSKVENSKLSKYLMMVFAIIGFIGTVIGIWAYVDSVKKQKELDVQLSKSYLTEIQNFYTHFRVGLHWTLPLGDFSDKEVDSTFRYDRYLLEDQMIKNVDKELISNILIKYDFAKPMINYDGEDINGGRPTGYNHLLGNLIRFQNQLEKHLSKYGNSASHEITNRIEQTQSFTKAQITFIRLELKTKGKLGAKTVGGYGDLFIRLQNDYYWLKDNYTSEILPVPLGIVNKSDPKSGSILVEWQYGEY